MLNITKDNFESEVMKSKEPVLIDFYADWCMPCRMLSPTIEQIAQETTGKAKVGKVNIDAEPELARKFGVMSIPTLVVIKDGKVATTAVGSRPKQAILDLLDV